MKSPELWMHLLGASEIADGILRRLNEYNDTVHILSIFVSRWSSRSYNVQRARQRRWWRRRLSFTVVESFVGRCRKLPIKCRVRGRRGFPPRLFFPALGTRMSLYVGLPSRMLCQMIKWVPVWWQKDENYCVRCDLDQQLLQLYRYTFSF